MSYFDDLDRVKQELLDRENEVITFGQLVDRFEEVERTFGGTPWNLLQIYSNFNCLSSVGKMVQDNDDECYPAGVKIVIFEKDVKF